MIVEPTDKQWGGLKARIYDFPAPGDELPKHTHDETTTHVSFVLRGSFRVFGGTWEITAKAGDILDWKPHQEHGFVALKAGSRLVNITK